MNVSEIQSAIGPLVDTWSTATTQRQATSAQGAVTAFRQSDTSWNTFTNNNYSHLGAFATTSTFSAADLLTSQLSASTTAITLAQNAADERYNEERNGVLTSAVGYLDDGNPAEARTIAQGLLDEDGQDAAAAHIIGRSYLDEQDYEAAETYFARASALAPDSTRFSSDLNNTRLLKQSDDKVLEAASRLVRQPERRLEGIRLLSYLADRSPDNADAHMILGDALMDEGWAGASVASYRNALIAADESQLDQLTLRFRELTQEAPDAGVTHSLLGQALQKQGHYDEAMVELKRAAAIAPANMSYHYAVAGVYGDLGHEALEQRKPADAIRYYQEAIARDPTSEGLKSGLARAHLGMAKWWQSRGQDQKASTELNAARRRAPSDDEALNKDIASTFNLFGDRYRHAGDLSWAITSYERAFDLDSENLSYRRDLGMTYDAKGTELFDAGEFEAAESYYQKAVDLYPGSETYQAHLQAAKDAQQEE
jgi:tetratricopeptide (TPR) repeat protein